MFTNKVFIALVQDLEKQFEVPRDAPIFDDLAGQHEICLQHFEEVLIVKRSGHHIVGVIFENSMNFLAKSFFELFYKGVFEILTLHP